MNHKSKCLSYISMSEHLLKYPSIDLIILNSDLFMKYYEIDSNSILLI